MDNVLDKNNIADMNAYRSIKDLMFPKQNQPVAQSSANKPRQAPTITHNQNITSQPKGSKSKNKKKFSDVKSFESKQKKAEGRKECNCEGQEHDFMNNCLNCGRIYCYEEGPGPCFFCGEPVSIFALILFFVYIFKTRLV